MSFENIYATQEFRNTSTYNHAIRELDAVFNPDDEYDRMFAVDVLQLLGVFANQGHSGFSAPNVIQLFTKLAAHEPLSPLTGEDSEWNDVSNLMGQECWQNKRASNVFKDSDGTAYQIDYYIFEDDDGFTYTNKDSRKTVEFPYTPGREYVVKPMADD